jgi:hypothetical protein
MNRREFVKLLGLGGAGMLVSPRLLATMSIQAQSNLTPKLIFDGRYPFAMEYAMRLHQSGIPSVDTEGDLVGLWYRNSDAFRLRPGQAMLGYTTWSDYRSLRILIDDARLGRDPRLERQGNPGRLTLLQQDSGEPWPQALAGHFPATSGSESGVHLVTWLAINSPATNSPATR